LRNGRARSAAKPRHLLAEHLRRPSRHWGALLYAVRIAGLVARRGGAGYGFLRIVSGSGDAGIGLGTTGHWGIGAIAMVVAAGRLARGRLPPHHAGLLAG